MKVLRVLLAAVAFATCPRAAGQLPPARGGSPLPGSFGAAGGQSAALQDAVEGIAGLMQRFQSLQPQLAGLPPAELEGIARPAQELHERFLSMQGRMAAAAGSAGPQLEAEAISFHKDLANFVDEVSARLGLSGPRSGTPFQQVSMGSLPQAGQARPGGLASADTERRLQMTMQAIQTGMQRFQVLHGKLQNLPQQAFQTVAAQAQKLHEEFLVLQQRGISLAGDNKPMLEADAAPYVEQLQSYVSRQASFIEQVDQQVQSLPGGFGGGPGYQGMAGSQIPLPPSSGLGQGLGAGPAPISMPPLQAGGASAGVVPGQVTPATDKRLSVIIDKVVQLMQDFQGLAPQLARANPQALSSIASTGTKLDTRFRDMQQRGSLLAGDGSRPMSEADARAYTEEMEAFYDDQVRYVEQTKQIIKSSSETGGLGTFGRPGGLGGGLGSASLEDLRGSGLSSNIGGSGGGGTGGLASTSLGAGSFGRGNFRSGSFGNLGPGGATGLGATFGSLNSGGQGSLGRSFGSSTGFGTGFAGASGRPMMAQREVEASGLEALAGLETVQLDTAVLPNIGSKNK